MEFTNLQQVHKDILELLEAMNFGAFNNGA